MAKCLKIGPRTVSRVMATARDTTVDVQLHPETRGRKTIVDNNAVVMMRGILLQNAALGHPSSTRSLRDMLAEQNIHLDRKTIYRTVRRMGFKWLKGYRRLLAAEKPEIQAFRAAYLRRKLLNRDANNIPRRPEIYLDESFIHEHHTRELSWVHAENKKLYAAPTSRGNRYVIVGAGVVQKENDHIKASWVNDAIKVWNTSKRRRMGPGGGSDSDDYQFEEDYHGNMNADKFERWFRGLCEMCEEMYGPSIIIMDGCAAHKRLTAETVKTNWTKGRLQQSV